MSRRRREVETTDFLGFARRIIRRSAARVAADGDPADLRELMDLRAEIDAAITTAVRGLREPDANGVSWSWGEIARELGVSRQAAQQRYTRGQEASA